MENKHSAVRIFGLRELKRPALGSGATSALEPASILRRYRVF